MNPIFKLIDTFARLMPDEGSARMFVARASMESGLIGFDARATINWTNIVTEALNQTKLDDLVGAAAGIYSEAGDLRAHLEEYKAWAEANPTTARRLFLTAKESDRSGGAGAIGSWNAILERSQKHTKRFLAGNRVGPGGAGSYDPDLYVRRETAEKELDRFLAGSSSALILIGDSGAGKTSVLCKWTSDLLEQGHAVLAYDCAALAQTDVEAEILRDLAMPPNRAPLETFEQIDAEAGGAGRYLVVVFDSIGDYRGGEQNGVQNLLRRINELAGRDGQNVRVVVSCNAATWSRLERVAPIRLDDRYFRSAEGEPFVRVGPYTAEELEAAYRRYRQAFDLFSPFEDLHPAVCERLRDPVLLRMAAETYRGVRQPLLPVNVGLGIYRRFFEERVKTERERWLVDTLAGEMITRGTAALSTTDLARHEALGPEILSEDASSTYSRLLDRGVLQEWRGNVRAGVLVKFAHGSVAAYVLAMHLLQENPDVAKKAAELIADETEFPLAWDVARTLLLESRDEGAIAALATSHDLEERELVVEALVELHTDDPKTACRLLESLLDQSAEEARRTALKAAYKIGPLARDVFLRAAIEGDASMRESVKNTLYMIWRSESSAGRQAVAETVYLIWRHAPGFTHEFLNTLLGVLVPKNLVKYPKVVLFVLDLTIVIYINHCEDEDVIEKTAALVRDLAVDRLHMDKGIVQKVFVLAVEWLAEDILKWIMGADTEDAGPFFARPSESRAALGRIAEVFDPASSLDAVHDDLAQMLQSREHVFAGSAAMAIAVHATHDFAATEPLIRRLWGEVDAGGRLWILMSFSVLLADTPAEWVDLLEDLTRDYIEKHDEAFLGQSSRLAGDLDIVLLPLGLAYGKARSPMPLFAQLLTGGLAADNTPRVVRCIAALAAVGFYYPRAVFEVLQPVMKSLDQKEVAAVVVSTLATMRTLHFDAVDQFLNREGVSEEMRHRIDAAADVSLVHRFIRVLGFYNNAVHFTLRYPRMRKSLSAGALNLLVEARSAKQFVGEYAETFLRMARESDFQVLEWTKPE